MHLTSASKYQREQRRKENFELYAKELEGVFSIALHRAAADFLEEHPRLQPRIPFKRSWLIVLGADRGLCGAYNNNLFSYLEKYEFTPAPEKVVLFGTKAVFWGRKHFSQRQERPQFLQHIDFNHLWLEAESLARAYAKAEYDVVWLAYQRMRSPTLFEPVVEQFLPLSRPVSEPATEQVHQMELVVEPDFQQLLEFILPQYITALLFRAVLELLVGNEASRMIAMQKASENAENEYMKKKRQYQHARQTKITNEVLEITSGRRTM